MNFICMNDDYAKIDEEYTKKYESKEYLYAKY